MKSFTPLRKFPTRFLPFLCVLLIGCAATTLAADFTNTTPGGQFNFNINGTNSPTTITLVRGRLYEFTIGTSSFHPFQIMSNTTALGPAQGVTNNNISSGAIFFRVPTNAVNYSFRCGVHTGTATLQGTIQTVAAPVPPVPVIVSFQFSTNILLRTAPAADGFTVVPEFRTNLNFTNWVPLVVQTNRFLTGTNETICGRPAGSNLFLRVRVL